MRQEFQDVLTNVRKALEFLAQDASAVETLGAAMKEDGTLKPSELAEFYFHIKDLHEKADDAVKKMYHVHDMLNKHLIPARLKEEGLTGIRVPSVARSFSIVTKTSATFVDKDAGLEWLRSIGQKEMIQETVNAGTLSSFCRNMMLEQGIDPPDGIVKVSTYDTTSMVKYKPKPGEGA
jgi:hypothetical protein